MVRYTLKLANIKEIFKMAKKMELENKNLKMETLIRAHTI